MKWMTREGFLSEAEMLYRVAGCLKQTMAWERHELASKYFMSILGRFVKPLCSFSLALTRQIVRHYNARLELTAVILHFK